MPRCYPEAAFLATKAIFGKIFALLLPRCGVGFSKTPKVRGAEPRPRCTGRRIFLGNGYLASKWRFLNRLRRPSEMSHRTGANVLSPKLILSALQILQTRWEREWFQR